MVTVTNMRVITKTQILPNPLELYESEIIWKWKSFPNPSEAIIQNLTKTSKAYKECFGVWSVAG